MSERARLNEIHETLLDMRPLLSYETTEDRWLVAEMFERVCLLADLGELTPNDRPVPDQTGADYETVECFLPSCHSRLRRSDYGVPQFCSRDHRDRASAIETGRDARPVAGQGKAEPDEGSK